MSTFTMRLSTRDGERRVVRLTQEEKENLKTCGDLKKLIAREFDMSDEEIGRIILPHRAVRKDECSEEERRMYESRWQADRVFGVSFPHFLESDDTLLTERDFSDLFDVRNYTNAQVMKVTEEEPIAAFKEYVMDLSTLGRMRGNLMPRLTQEERDGLRQVKDLKKMIAEYWAAAMENPAHQIQGPISPDDIDTIELCCPTTRGGRTNITMLTLRDDEMELTEQNLIDLFDDRESPNAWIRFKPPTATATAADAPSRAAAPVEAVVVAPAPLAAPSVLGLLAPRAPAATPIAESDGTPAAVAQPKGGRLSKPQPTSFWDRELFGMGITLWGDRVQKPDKGVSSKGTMND